MQQVGLFLQRRKKPQSSNQSCISRSPGAGSSSSAPPRAAGVGSARWAVGGGRWAVGGGRAAAGGGRAWGGPGESRGSVPAAGGGSRGPSRPRPAGPPPRQGGAVRDREWAGDESPAPGHPPGDSLLWLGGFGFVLFSVFWRINSVSAPAHGSPRPPSPLGIAAGRLGSCIQMCLSGHTAKHLFFGRDCTCCCLSVHLVELPGRLRWATSFKNDTK